MIERQPLRTMAILMLNIAVGFVLCIDQICLSATSTLLSAPAPIPNIFVVILVFSGVVCLGVGYCDYWLLKFFLRKS